MCYSVSRVLFGVSLLFLGSENDLTLIYLASFNLISPSPIDLSVLGSLLSGSVFGYVEQRVGRS